MNGAWLNGRSRKFARAFLHFIETPNQTILDLRRGVCHDRRKKGSANNIRGSPHLADHLWDLTNRRWLHFNRGDSGDARDPMPRWTDVCPLPVLALCVVLSMGIPLLPWTLFSPAVAVFGTYFGGVPAACILLAITFVCTWAAYSCYRLKVRGWWTALLMVCVCTLSTLITFARCGLWPMYEAMGFPAEYLAKIKQYDFLEGPPLYLMTIAGTLPVIGLLAYTKRYFKK